MCTVKKDCFLMIRCILCGGGNLNPFLIFCTNPINENDKPLTNNNKNPFFEYDLNGPVSNVSFLERIVRAVTCQ